MGPDTIRTNEHLRTRWQISCGILMRYTRTIHHAFGQIAVAKLEDLLSEPSKWEEALSLLQSPPLADAEFRTTLDRYSDSNWEKHILGDLYRNQSVESIKVCFSTTGYENRIGYCGVAGIVITSIGALLCMV